MLTLTRKTDYALIALTHLCHNKENCTSAREIATLYGLPLPLLMNVLKLLGQQGLAKSVRGPKGGYQLALPATEITLHDIILAVEGPIQLVQCTGHPEHADDVGPSEDVDDFEQAAFGSDSQSLGGHPIPVHNGAPSDSNDAPRSENGQSIQGCELMCTCPVRHPIRRIQNKLVEFVRSVTLADVAESNGICEENDPTRAMAT